MYFVYTRNGIVCLIEKSASLFEQTRKQQQQQHTTSEIAPHNAFAHMYFGRVIHSLSHSRTHTHTLSYGRREYIRVVAVGAHRTHENNAHTQTHMTYGIFIGFTKSPRNLFFDFFFFSFLLKFIIENGSGHFQRRFVSIETCFFFLFCF